MKSKTLIFSLIVFLVLTISVGYSALNETLSISGTAIFSVYQDIEFMKGEVYYNKQAQVVDTIKLNGTNVSGQLSLDQLDSNLVYKVTVINNGDLNIVLQDSEFITFTNDNITYDIIGIDDSNIIHPNEEHSFLISFKYKDSITDIPTTTGLDFRIKFNFTNTSKSNIVANDSMLLYVTDADKKYDNYWFDRSFNQDVTLNNVTYSSIGYEFDGSNSCGLTNRTVIPTVGDFTVEMKFTTSSNVAGDLSLLAQKNMNANKELGRMKFFNIYEGTIRFFAIGSIFNDTVVPLYSNSVFKEQTYYLTVKREGDSLYLFANGVVVNTVSFNSANVLSSGTMQIGCYDAINSQNFTGEVHLLRVYNRALNNQEIHNNFLDSSNTQTVEDSNLISNLVSKQLVTSGDGLYYNATDDKFVFKGKNVNNYIEIDSEVWRIISINSDNTIKIARFSNIVKNIPFDASFNRSTITSPYCLYADTDTSDALAPKYGCNAWLGGNITFGGTSLGTTLIEASIVNYLNNDIYNGFSNDLKGRIIESQFNVGLIPLNASYNTVKQVEGELKWTGKVATLSVLDILDSLLTTAAVNTGNLNSYLMTLSNESLFIWTMNGTNNNTWDVWTMVNGKILGPRRGSRISQSITTTLIADFGIIPVINIDGNIEVTGNGSALNPYVFKS